MVLFRLYSHNGTDVDDLIFGSQEDVICSER